jgi:hypothetical protein
LTRLAGPLIGVLALSVVAQAQSTGFNFAVHANSRVTAEDIGMPAFPGATLNRHSGNDAAFDLGLTLGSKEFRLRGISYLSDASPDEILAFYRGALSHYGQVLECEHGRPVGAVTRTREGLTCDEHPDHDIHVDGANSGSDERDLRAGSPQSFRLAAIESPSGRPTKFVLMHVQIPEHHE